MCVLVCYYVEEDGVAWCQLAFYDKTLDWESGFEPWSDYCVMYVFLKT